MIASLDALWGYLPWLLATITVELGVVAVLAPAPLRARLLLVVVFANVLTHPLAMLAVVEFPQAWLPTELLVVLIEAFAYLNARTRRKIEDDFPELAEGVLQVFFFHQ